jgi:hypothetical protein
MKGPSAAKFNEHAFKQILDQSGSAANGINQTLGIVKILRRRAWDEMHAGNFRFSNSKFQI